MERITIPLKYFLIRKIIHFLFGIISITALLLIPQIAVYVLSITAVLFFVFDLLRRREGKWRRLFYDIFGKMLKSAESKGGITGATTFLMTVSGLTFSFPQRIVVVAILILSISDPLASIAGKIYPARKIWKEKSFTGSITFFLSSLVFYQLFAPPSILLLVFASLIITLIELFAPEILENILIGFGAAFIFVLIF